MRAYPIRAITMVIAPYQHTLTFKHVREIVNKKYGSLKLFDDEEPAEKLDRAFDRWMIGTAYKPVLYGSTIYAALKRALGLSGKDPLPVKIAYAVFDEEDIGVYVYNIYVNGKKTLVQYEALRSGAQGYVVAEGLETLNRVSKGKIVLQVGPHRKHGFGILELSTNP